MSKGGTNRDFTSPSFEAAPRIRIPVLPVSERIKSMDVEDTPSLGLGEIETEAGRCFNCGCLAVSPSDIGIALVALDANVVTTKRTLDAQRFFTASATASTALDMDELVTEIQIPKPKDGVRQSYLKFTLRTPIDFGIVSVASVIASQGRHMHGCANCPWGRGPVACSGKECRGSDQGATDRPKCRRRSSRAGRRGRTTPQHECLQNRNHKNPREEGHPELAHASLPNYFRSCVSKDEFGVFEGRVPILGLKS